MGRSHALSGAVGWLGLCTAAGPVAGLHPSGVQVGAGAVLAAGAALLPDIDHHSSTVSRSLWFVTRFASRVVSWTSDAVRDHTCGCCATEGTSGHRTLTHTGVFAVLAGVLCGLAGWRWGAAGAAWIVGVGAGLAALGLVRRVVWLQAVAAGVGAGLAVWWWGGGLGWWWLGVPAGWGVLAHALGDAVTVRGVPLFWPLKIAGCRWYPAGPPRWLRFRAGGPRERVVWWLMVAGGVAAGVVLVRDAPWFPIR